MYVKGVLHNNEAWGQQRRSLKDESEGQQGK